MDAAIAARVKLLLDEALRLGGYRTLPDAMVLDTTGQGAPVSRARALRMVDGDAARWVDGASSPEGAGR